MDKPSYVFADNNSLWAFYNYITLALQQSHPKTWMEDQRILHYFINSVNNFPVCSQPAQVPVEEVIVTEDTAVNFNFKDVIEAINPNQISLLDQIADMEADMMDEDIRYAANEVEETILTEHELAHQLYGVDNDIEVSIAAPENEELIEEEEVIDQIEVEELTLEQPEESILQYTDKDGNTFESIEFHNAAVETEVELSEKIDEVILSEFAEPDNLDFDFNEETIENQDSSSDFF
jgi:hypothetical protein